MNSRERLIAAINHKKPDKVPLDIGATAVTGIHALALDRLRKRLNYTDKPVIVYEVLQQLGLIETEDIQALGIDVCGILPYSGFTGAVNDEFVPYANTFGIDLFCPKGYKTKFEPETGNTYAYPQGDLSAEPSQIMPEGGCFFDNIDRSQHSLDDSGDPVKDLAAESFAVMSDAEAEFYQKQAEQIKNSSDLGLIGNLAPAGFGDVAFLPGPGIKSPRGIRSMTDWIMAHKIIPEYVHAVYEYHAEIGLKNLEIYRQAVGDSIQVIFMGGTDFGTQRGLMIAREDFREFYMPYWKKMNNWVHENTNWKTFYHTCGAVSGLIGDFIESGADILNPVQCSAEGMEAEKLKKEFGSSIVFWGGGMDTQKILPFGTEEEVREMVRDRIDVFSENGGFIFNTIHNIQADTPIENIAAMLDEVGKYR